MLVFTFRNVLCLGLTDICFDDSLMRLDNDFFLFLLFLSFSLIKKKEIQFRFQRLGNDDSFDFGYCFDYFALTLAFKIVC